MSRSEWVVGQVAPHPVEQYVDFVSHAQDGAEVDHQPQLARLSSLAFSGAEFCHRLVSAHGCHASQVAVTEGLHGFSFLQADEVCGEEASLLDGYLGELRMSAPDIPCRRS